VPVAALVGLILGGGAEVDVGGADPDVGGAVVLDSFGDGEVDFENDCGPGPRTSGGRRVVETLGIEVVELESAIELDLAGRRFRTRYRGIGEGGVAGTDLEMLSDGDGGEHDEQRSEQGGEFRKLGRGH